MPNSTDEGRPNARSARYLIVESRILCLQCNTVTAVFAFALRAGYESLFVDDDTPDDEDGTWEAPGVGAVLSYVEYLSEPVASRIRAMTQHYQLDIHGDTGHTFWMNHCAHCGAQLEEEELHGEPEGPFRRLPYEGPEAIRVSEVHEPFEAWAGRESHDTMPLNS